MGSTGGADRIPGFADTAGLAVLPLVGDDALGFETTFAAGLAGVGAFFATGLVEVFAMVEREAGFFSTGFFAADFFAIYGVALLGPVKAIDRPLGGYRVHRPASDSEPGLCGI